MRYAALKICVTLSFESAFFIFSFRYVIEYLYMWIIWSSYHSELVIKCEFHLENLQSYLLEPFHIWCMITKFNYRKFSFYFSGFLCFFHFPCLLLTYEINLSITVYLIFNSKSYLKLGFEGEVIRHCEGRRLVHHVASMYISS